MQIKDCCVDQGGLMRCCLETLNDKREQKVKYGEVIPCKYCTSTMILTERKTSVKGVSSKKPVIIWNYPPSK